MKAGGLFTLMMNSVSMKNVRLMVRRCGLNAWPDTYAIHNLKCAFDCERPGEIVFHIGTALEL